MTFENAKSKEDIARICASPSTKVGGPWDTPAPRYLEQTYTKAHKPFRVFQLRFCPSIHFLRLFRYFIVMAVVEYTGGLVYKLLFTALVGIIVKWFYDTSRRHRVGEVDLNRGLLVY